MWFLVRSRIVRGMKPTPPDNPNPTPAPSIPASATRAALVALLRADKGISATHRARILAAFDAPDGEAGRPEGWVPASVAAKKNGIYLTTLLDWAEAGKVASRRVGDRLTLVNLEEVSAFAALHPRRTRRPKA